jgi:hypothetical protein
MNKLQENFKKYIPLNRKERFFSGTILPQIICNDNFKYFSRFTDLIKGFPKDIIIKPDISDNNIQFFSEYSLKESNVKTSFREQLKGHLETKDTPDVMILITEPELILIVIEIKVFSGINYSDFVSQLKAQEHIIKLLQNNLELKDENIFHIGLVPQKLFTVSNIDKRQILFWEDVLNAYKDILSNNYFIGVLEMALENFDELKSQSKGFDTFGKNMDGKLNGDEIIEWYKRGKKIWIGRKGGINGEKFWGDLKSGNWKTYSYEINLKHKPNDRNWFSSEEFVKEIEHYNSQPAVFQTHPIESKEVNVKKDKFENPWDFRYLKEKFFLKIANIVCKVKSLDVPIKTVFTGKSGVPYEEITNREINPNWAVILEDGKEYKFGTPTGKKLVEGHWNRSKCNEFNWQEIKNYYKNN